MGRRDSRADFIDDDPFKNMQSKGPKIHRVHVRQSEDGTIHFDNRGADPIRSIISQMWGASQEVKAKHHSGGLWHFSSEEKKHLMWATGAFTLALGFMYARGLSGLLAYGPASWAVNILIAMPMMLIAIGPAFVLHEIGHKIVAKHYGCWAEFRADPRGLKFGMGLAFLLGFIFMAPGAVMVAGLVTRRQNGHIAVAGPLVNLALFIIGIPLAAITLGLTDAFSTSGEILVNGALNWKAMLVFIWTYWLQANLILGLFNMLPFGPLDGNKVKDWNEKVFYLVIAIFAVPILTMFMGYWNVNDLLVTISSWI